MTRIAAVHDAINLSQGYPDFDPPRELTEAAKRALDAGFNQYSITWGAPELRDAIARRAKTFNGIIADPESNLVVTCGTTEAMMAAMLSLVKSGDEAVIFEPFYENYGSDDHDQRALEDLQCDGMASRLGDCAQDPRERDAANARLPHRRRAASLADRDGRGSEPARIVLPKSRVDVPEEAGLLRPRPSGNRLRLP